MSVKLLTEHHLEFPRLKGGCTCASESKCQNATMLEISCTGSYDVRNACLLVSVMARFYLLYRYAEEIQMYASNTLKNKLTTFLRNTLHKKHVKFLVCCHSRRKCTIYETCANLHRFHIVYIFAPVHL